jgi:uncharacterized protein YjbJ (UPF0337 family)
MENLPSACNFAQRGDADVTCKLLFFKRSRVGMRFAFAVNTWWARPTADQEDTTMNWDQVKGDWMKFKGKVREQWGNLTDDQLDRIAGKRDQLAGEVQKAYGVTKEEAERQIKKFEARCDASEKQ